MIKIWLYILGDSVFLSGLQPKTKLKIKNYFFLFFFVRLVNNSIKLNFFFFIFFF